MGFFLWGARRGWATDNRGPNHDRNGSKLMIPSGRGETSICIFRCTWKPGFWWRLDRLSFKAYIVLKGGILKMEADGSSLKWPHSLYIVMDMVPPIRYLRFPASSILTHTRIMVHSYIDLTRNLGIDRIRDWEYTIHTDIQFYWEYTIHTYSIK